MGGPEYRGGLKIGPGRALFRGPNFYYTCPYGQVAYWHMHAYGGMSGPVLADSVSKTTAKN